MRLRELYESPNTGTNLPDSVKHSLPHTVIFPKMDSYYEFYRFVVALASHPDAPDDVFKTRSFRDVPMAVAYTQQEFDMIKNVAKRLGKEWEEVAFQKSQEQPGVNAVSPVMKFNMTESHIDIMRALLKEMEK